MSETVNKILNELKNKAKEDSVAEKMTPFVVNDNNIKENQSLLIDRKEIKNVKK